MRSHGRNSLVTEAFNSQATTVFQYSLHDHMRAEIHWSQITHLMHNQSLDKRLWRPDTNIQYVPNVMDRIGHHPFTLCYKKDVYEKPIVRYTDHTPHYDTYYCASSWPLSHRPCCGVAPEPWVKLGLRKLLCSNANYERRLYLRRSHSFQQVGSAISGKHQCKMLIG